MFKFDKQVFMGFMQSVIGGIIAAIIVSIKNDFRSNNPIDWIFYFVILLIFMILGLFGIAHLNFRWEQGKGRIQKKKKINGFGIFKGKKAKPFVRDRDDKEY